MLFILSAPSLILQKIREVWIFLWKMLEMYGGKSNQVDKEGLWISISVIAYSLSRFEGDDHNIQGELDETHHFVHFQKSTSKLRSSM